MRVIPMAVIVLLVSACGLIPANKTELFQSGPRSEKYCYSDAIPEIGQRLRTYLLSCYRTVSRSTAIPINGVIVPVKNTFQWTVEEETTSEGIQFAVSGPYGYGFGARLSGPEQQCAAVLQVFAGNQMWANRFETLDSVARMEKVDCPY